MNFCRADTVSTVNPMPCWVRCFRIWCHFSYRLGFFQPSDGLKGLLTRLPQNSPYLDVCSAPTLSAACIPHFWNPDHIPSLPLGFGLAVVVSVPSPLGLGFCLHLDAEDLRLATTGCMAPVNVTLGGEGPCHGWATARRNRGQMEMSRADLPGVTVWALGGRLAPTTRHPQ